MWGGWGRVIEWDNVYIGWVGCGWMGFKSDLGTGLVGALVCSIGWLLIPSLVYNKNPLNMLPRSENIQEGFAVPNKIEMYLDDLDGGENKHIFQYDGVDYLLKIDDQDRPYFQSYSVKPAKIVPGDYDSRSQGLEKTVSDKKSE